MEAPKSIISLRAELTPQQAHDLKTFLRRVTFERTLEHCNGCVDQDTRNDECYRMIEALVIVESALDEARQ
jgi:hypothetical protein